MSEFHAQPYVGGKGFYFTSMKEFEKGMKALEKRGIEEVELQVIDEDDPGDAQLFEAVGISQGNIDRWFEDIEPLREDEKAALYYLFSSYGETDLDDALQKVEDEVRPFEGTVVEYAQDLADSTGEGVGAFTNSEFYFDMEAFGRDLRLNSEDGSQEVQDEIDEAERELEDARVKLAEARKELKSADEDDVDDAEAEVENAESQVEEWEENLREAKERFDELDRRTDEEIGEEYIDSMGGVKELDPNTVEVYFDWDALARDMEMGGDVNQFDFAGSSWVVDYV